MANKTLPHAAGLNCIRQVMSIHYIYIYRGRGYIAGVPPPKTHAGPDDPCESCADSAATVNVHRLAAYRPPWLTEVA